MAKYEETIKKIKESSGSSAFSRAAEEQLANALLNALPTLLILLLIVCKA